MRGSIRLVWAVALSATLLGAQTQAAKTLDIYVIDAEGDSAVLFVSPAGESLLIDTGNTGAAAARNADRIMAAVKDAGLKQIDHVIITHWHGGHWGGIEKLAERLPILEFIDHGPSVEHIPNADAFLAKTYAELYGKVKHTVVKAGDRIPVAGLDVRVLTSAGLAIQKPLPGAGAPNPLCADFKPQKFDNPEDAQSVGSLISYGKFRALDLGDLTSDKEFALMCPNNRIGSVDLFVVSQHGLPSANSRFLVHAIRPRVAIMNNGTRKGGLPEVMKILHSSPGLEDLWQIHFSLLSGQEYTVPGMFIANSTDEPQPTMPVAPLPEPPPGAGTPAPVHNGTAYWIKASAQADGTFTVTNSRNGFSKTYRPRSLSRSR
jgi:competence protein ComEC